LRVKAAPEIECAAMAEDVRAHITGTVWKIEVREGDEVAEEQTLVILESMKMEMPVESPASGRVAKIHVSEGQAVDDGDVLVTLE
jgi:acetyl-CoA carboxylase biotin carboxyl carrier protein